MPEQLKGKRVAALVTKGFERVELLEPRAAPEGASATVHVVAPEADTVRG